APLPTMVRNGVAKVSVDTIERFDEVLSGPSLTVRWCQRSPIAPVPRATMPRTKEATAAIFMRPAARRLPSDRTAAAHPNQQNDDGDDQQDMQDAAKRVLRNHPKQP